MYAVQSNVIQYEILCAHKETKTADPAPYSNPVKCQALSADAHTKLALTKGPREQSRHLKSTFDLIVHHHRAHFRESSAAEFLFVITVKLNYQY